MPTFLRQRNVIFGPPGAWLTGTRGNASCGRGPRIGPIWPTRQGARNYVLSGVTRDSSGTPLGSCVVHLFNAGDDTEVAMTISDGSGNFTFTNTPPGPFYLVAYKAGSPDVSGTSLNTLMAS